jgi:heterodisulfide reductase subunit A
MEFERLISGTGPNQGQLLRPSDGKEICKIAWLQCVGSRDQQANADFCSSICCMFAIKEALLAKEKSDGQLDAAIFYMDMRAFGKDFHRYRERAEKEHEVRFLRSRIHTIEAGPDNRLSIAYADVHGTRCEEDFDVVVLSAGQRPPAGTEELAEINGIELNPWGFCQLENFSLSRTSNEGVMVGGSFAGLRDISESVIQAGSASFEASRLIHSKGGGLAEEPGPDTKYRDVSREIPSVLVSICKCGDTRVKAEDSDALEAWLKRSGSVNQVHFIDQVCTQEGWDQLQDTVQNSSANRVLIGACMPYVYAKRIRELGERVGLNPSLIDVVDIHTPAFPGNELDKDRLTHSVRTVLSTGISRLRGMGSWRRHCRYDGSSRHSRPRV